MLLYQLIIYMVLDKMIDLRKKKKLSLQYFRTNWFLLDE